MCSRVCSINSLRINLTDSVSQSALCEKPLKKLNLEFASPSGVYSTFHCLLLSFLIVNPFILQNTLWSYKIYKIFFLAGIACIGEPLIEKSIF